MMPPRLLGTLCSDVTALMVLSRVDVSYFNSDEEGDDDEIIEYIVEARRALKNGLAVAFLEHTSALGEALREAAYDMPVMSVLLDQEVYDGIEIDTFANMGFSFNVSGAVAADNFQDAGVEVHPSCHITTFTK